MKSVEERPIGNQLSYVVRAKWDDEAKVWVAVSDDVPGLVAEAPSMEKLIKKLRVLIPEMLEANGVSTPPVYEVRLMAPVPGADRASGLKSSRKVTVDASHGSPTATVF
jgi:hypothetical protein